MNEFHIKSEVKTENDEDQCFYFESDHLALRGNNDYNEVLKAMFILEAQRQRALDDFNQVVGQKKACLKDPLSYAEKRENGTLDIPPMQQIAEVPKINWSKYNSNVPEQFMRQISLTQMTANTKQKKPTKNTNAWTAEEQRKLEELLAKYPPEEFEQRRIHKIASELGTRTRAQVSSRLQKYYLKLLSAGLPVPGRLPKSAQKYMDRKNPHKKPTNHGHYHRKYMKPTTFFPDTIIPVVMDDDHAPGPSTSSSHMTSDLNSPSGDRDHKNDYGQNNYLMPNDYLAERTQPVKKSEVDLEVALLKWVKSEKILESTSESQLYNHYGYKCDYCADEPIQGSRWHCTTCANDSVDFCTDCILSQLYSTSSHDLRHKFIVIRNETDVTSGPWSDSESDGDSSDNENDDEDDEEDSQSGKDESMNNIGEDSSELAPNLEFFDVNGHNLYGWSSMG